jgi:ATP-dependent RNA helicase SUPV3L1/SUV3
MHRRYDVAVIDEIQMLGDKDRGDAWTRALLGIAAEEVHVCGDPSALELVQKLCRITGTVFL